MAPVSGEMKLGHCIGKSDTDEHKINMRHN